MRIEEILHQRVVGTIGVLKEMASERYKTTYRIYHFHIHTKEPDDKKIGRYQNFITADRKWLEFFGFTEQEILMLENQVAKNGYIIRR